MRQIVYVAYLFLLLFGVFMVADSQSGDATRYVGAGLLGTWTWWTWTRREKGDV